jgi:hypothetical protein
MKKQSIYISFLDLVFSLLGSTTILTIILAITAGRSEHQLQRDYIRVTVHWRSMPAPGKDSCGLWDGSSAQTPWSFQVHPRRNDAIDDLVSVFFFSPARADVWTLRHEAAGPQCDRIVIETKRETSVYPDFPLSGELTIETRE